MKMAISMGDPAGIGPELILRCAATIKRLGVCTIFANRRIMERTSKDIHLQRNYRILKPFIADCTRTTAFLYGKPTRHTGMTAMRSIDCALEDKPDILITPPIHKAVIQETKPDFTGHTEYLARYFNIKDFAMVGLWRTKRIMLLTTHVPLRKVSSYITRAALLRKFRLLDWGLKKYFTVKTPSIGVSALNPHGFEFSLGEDEIIENALFQAREQGFNVHGPFPADSLFNRTFDGYLAMYHDQAMIYLKSKRGGLNFTLGLPIIRLSPLYGAALDIAGKGIAEVSGLEMALKMGILLHKHARNYEQSKSTI